MPDDLNQASVPIPLDSEDNLLGEGSEEGSSSPPPSSLEQGSASEDSSQEHRKNWLEMDAEELVNLHPGLKSHFARTAKSQADKAVHRALQEKERENQEILRQRDAEVRDRDLDKFLAEADPEDIAEWVRSDRKRRKELEPILQYARKSGIEEGFQRGQLSELRNLGTTFEEVFPFWKDMTPAARQDYMANFKEPREFIVKLVQEGIQRGVTDYQTKERAKSKRELEIEDRTKEPNPDLGSGVATPGGKLTQREFDVNRRDINWMRANLSRVQEAVQSGTIRR